jgi:hypothetical protein
VTNHPHRNGGAGKTALLGLLLILLIVGGAWNYHRNYELEKQSRASRPLSGYSTDDLHALADAYHGEIASRSARYDAAKKAHVESHDRAYFDQQVQEFETVQRASNRTREAGAQVAEREASLKQVEAELAARGPERSEWQVHLDRLTKF